VWVLCCKYRYIRCVVFETTMAYSVGIVGSICGLIVITLERYVKIVHSLVHKQYYQPWMLTAGVILPWVNGVLQVTLEDQGYF